MIIVLVNQVKKKIEKHMQILRTFRYSALSSRIFRYLYKFDLLKSTIMRKFRSLADRINVTAIKTATFVFKIIFFKHD